MRPAAAAIVAVVAAIAGPAAGGCGKSDPPATERVVANGPQPALPAPTGPVTADALIHQARTKRADLFVSRIEVKYVRPDGVLDPTYGTIEINMVGPEPGPPPDDPNRPTGAPTSTAPTGRDRDCEDFRWSATTGWAPNGDNYMKMCMSLGVDEPAEVRCTVEQIWQRAIEDGAPANALARLSMITGILWSFTIDDAPRDVHFSHSYEDDCEPAAERTPP